MDALPSQGLLPSIRTVPFGQRLGPATQRLSTRDREHLASISSHMRLPAKSVIYPQGAPADAIFNVVEGVVCSYLDDGHGHRRVFAFLFPGDICGLARLGMYVNTARAVTPVRLFRIPLEPLSAMLLKDAPLQFHFLCKVTHALREAQRQMMVLARRNPAERVATFLSILEDHQLATSSTNGITVPISAKDAAGWLGMSADMVISAFRGLEKSGILVRNSATSIRILDRKRFDALASGKNR